MIEQQKNNAMDAMTAILTRRSIRRYTDQPVTEGELKAVLDAVFAGPTACDYRPVEVVVIRSQAAREQVAAAGRYTKMMTRAPLCLMICGDRKKQDVDSLLINDCSAAVENALLAAHATGLGAVWCGVVEGTDMQKKLGEIAKLPDNVRVMGLIALGHPDEKRDLPERYDAKRVHWENW